MTKLTFKSLVNNNKFLLITSLIMLTVSYFLSMPLMNGMKCNTLFNFKYTGIVNYSGIGYCKGNKIHFDAYPDNKQQDGFLSLTGNLLKSKNKVLIDIYDISHSNANADKQKHQVLNSLHYNAKRKYSIGNEEDNQIRLVNNEKNTSLLITVTHGKF